MDEDEIYQNPDSLFEDVFSITGISTPLSKEFKRVHENVPNYEEKMTRARSVLEDKLISTVVPIRFDTKLVTENFKPTKYIGTDYTNMEVYKSGMGLQAGLPFGTGSYGEPVAIYINVDFDNQKIRFKFPTGSQGYIAREIVLGINTENFDKQILKGKEVISFEEVKEILKNESLDKIVDIYHELR